MEFHLDSGELRPRRDTSVNSPVSKDSARFTPKLKKRSLGIPRTALFGETTTGMTISDFFAPKPEAVSSSKKNTPSSPPTSEAYAQKFSTSTSGCKSNPNSATCSRQYNKQFAAPNPQLKKKSPQHTTVTSGTKVKASETPGRQNLKISTSDEDIHEEELSLKIGPSLVKKQELDYGCADGEVFDEPDLYNANKFTPVTTLALKGYNTTFNFTDADEMELAWPRHPVGSDTSKNKTRGHYGYKSQLSKSTHRIKKRKNGRNIPNEEFEDIAIIKGLTSHAAYDRIGGNSVYQDIEDDRKFNPCKRSWQGIRNRVLKYIIPSVQRQVESGEMIYPFPKEALTPFLTRTCDDDETSMSDKDIHGNDLNVLWLSIVTEIICANSNYFQEPIFWQRLQKKYQDNGTRSIILHHNPDEIVKLIQELIVPNITKFKGHLQAEEFKKLKMLFEHSNSFNTTNSEIDDDDDCKVLTILPSPMGNYTVKPGGLSQFTENEKPKDMSLSGETEEGKSVVMDSDAQKFKNLQQAEDPASNKFNDLDNTDGDETDEAMQEAIDFVGYIYEDINSEIPERSQLARDFIRQILTLNLVLESFTNPNPR